MTDLMNRIQKVSAMFPRASRGFNDGVGGVPSGYCKESVVAPTVSSPYSSDIDQLHYRGCGKSYLLHQTYLFYR